MSLNIVFLLFNCKLDSLGCSPCLIKIKNNLDMTSRRNANEVNSIVTLMLFMRGGTLLQCT